MPHLPLSSKCGLVDRSKTYLANAGANTLLAKASKMVGARSIGPPSFRRDQALARGPAHLVTTKVAPLPSWAGRSPVQ
jgi:hypothetical protein